MQCQIGKISLNYTRNTEQTLQLKTRNTGINAGVDMSMVPNNPQYKTYINSLIELVKEGRVSHDRLDDNEGFLELVLS